MAISPPAQKSLLILAALVILAAIFVTAGFGLTRTRAETVTGFVQKVEGDSIFINGTYENDRGEGAAGPARYAVIEVVVGPTTTLVRRVRTLPTAEELAASGGFYDPDDLSFADNQGALHEIQPNMAVTARAAGNIYGQTKFEATEVVFVATIGAQ